MTLKLLVNKKGPRVLFAEAPKEFVDFLFHIFSLPLDDVFYPKTPFNGGTFLLTHDASSSEDQSGADKTAYRCPSATGDCYNCRNYKACRLTATLHANSICPNCRCSINVAMELVTPYKEDAAETKEDVKKKNGGYVKEVVTYMVTDDLVFKPMSAISSITLVNKFGVKDLSQLQEKMVYFGKDNLK
ncbi:hypothetical protein R6Q59_029633 [Mikania micrantha]